MQNSLIRTGVGALVREGTPLLKVVDDTLGANAAGGSLAVSSMLDELVRDAARQMLAVALQAEVAAYIHAHWHEVDEHGRRLVVRNGYHEQRDVLTAIGPVPVRAPRVNDKRVDAVTGERARFASAVLPAWVLKSRGWPRCFRCCICTGCAQATSRRRSSSSSAPATACPRR